MMTHLPIFAHGAVKKVLIIGGGDGGIAREAVKHPLEKVTMVELDRAVVDMTSQYMPRIPQGVFDNPKLELMFMDGCQFVKQTKERYDVIIVDSTDPVGPGAVLFTKEFYTDCCNLLTERGILVTQNGVPFFQGGELTQSVTFFRELMKDGYCYLAPIPSYFGGFMALGWASHDPQNRKQPLSVIEQRVAALNLDLQYYTPEMHVAAFALPGFVKKLLPA
jgi:spermidine synthase